MLLSALRARDGGHHPGLGAEGEHPDDVERQPIGGGQRVEPVFLVQFRDHDVRGRFPAPGP